MDFFTIIIIALGLSADSFAISVSSGIIISKIEFSKAMKIAFFLAIFQGTMPLIGWFLGVGFSEIIKDYDHWISFILLLFVGAKMIYDDFKKDENKSRINPLKTVVLIGLAIATSIDALIVGISFGLLEYPIIISCSIIFIATLLVSLSGIYLGCRFCRLINYKLVSIAGVVIIGIGVKILLEHTVLA